MTEKTDSDRNRCRCLPASGDVGCDQRGCSSSLASSDLEIFQAALTEGRVLVTNNVPDFESLRRAHEAAGKKVPGLIYTSDLTFPRTKAYMSGLAAALADAAPRRETARRGGVLWLRPPA